MPRPLADREGRAVHSELVQLQIDIFELGESIETYTLQQMLAVDRKVQDGDQLSPEERLLVRRCLVFLTAAMQLSEFDPAQLN